MWRLASRFLVFTGAAYRAVTSLLVFGPESAADAACAADHDIDADVYAAVS